MAPRVKNKKRMKQTKSPTQSGDNNYGRPPGTATTMAGHLLGPTPVLNPRRQSPCHQNDGGMSNLEQTHQVDQNPPRFELIESDKPSDDPATSSKEVESEEAPPAEVMPTTSQQPLAIVVLWQPLYLPLL